MNYQRDFTIGVKETQDFSRTLVLEAGGRAWWSSASWGPLCCWAYLMWLDLDLGPVLILAMMAGTALVTAGAMTASMLLANRSKARRQFYAEHRDSYLQQVDISGLGIRVTVGKDRARLSFDKLMKVRETRNTRSSVLLRQPGLDPAQGPDGGPRRGVPPAPGHLLHLSRRPPPSPAAGLTEQPYDM